MTLKEHTELMMCPAWTYHEVMLYCKVKKSKAFLIIKECKEKLNGKVLFEEHKVKRDSVLAYMGSSIEHERYVNKQLQEQAKQEGEHS